MAVLDRLKIDVTMDTGDRSKCSDFSFEDNSQNRVRLMENWCSSATAHHNAGMGIVVGSYVMHGHVLHQMHASTGQNVNGENVPGVFIPIGRAQDVFAHAQRDGHTLLGACMCSAVIYIGELHHRNEHSSRVGHGCWRRGHDEDLLRIIPSIHVCILSPWVTSPRPLALRRPRSVRCAPSTRRLAIHLLRASRILSPSTTPTQPITHQPRSPCRVMTT